MSTAANTAIIIGGALICAGALMRGYLCLPVARRHQCRWVTVAVSYPGAVRALPFSPVETIVLKRCRKCDSIETTTLLGQWTVEQLTTPLEAEAAPASKETTR
ncbi:hypothetical protein ACQPYK_25255 [Streptosporangium sp. CA-135522]|uniref:hypothetical protein n=1 Tax=Streptosporangium sp. CA-135522 TaxID=3240072 RepID=UPI003D8F4A35